MIRHRLVTLSGAVGIALVLASFIAAGTAPAAGAPTAEVVSFYDQHRTGQVVSAVLLSLGSVLFLVFTAAFVTFLQREDARPRAEATVCLGGGVLLTMGLTLFAGLSLALGDVGGSLDPSALRVLHVLNQELFYPVTVGTAAYLLGAGAGVLRTGALPRWLGVVALVFAAIAAVPSHVLGGSLVHIGFVGFMGLGLWTVVASGLLATRNGPAQPARPTGQEAAALG